MRLAAIHCYPVKSLGGSRLEACPLDACGLVHDRRWMVVDPEGAFLTQRSHPRMALVEATVEGDVLRLRAPSMPDHLVPASRSAPGGAGRARRPVEVAVWRDRVPAEDEGDAAAEWLVRALGMPCRLVRGGASFQRGVDDGEARTDRGRIAFADGFPFLLTSTASLDDLNRRLTRPVGMERFRPNLVVDGCGPFDEDRWKKIRIGEVEFRVAKPCERCSIPAVDPATGERGIEPLATLATYRRDPGGRILFGRNLVHETLEGTLRIGDPVTVLA